MDKNKFSWLFLSLFIVLSLSCSKSKLPDEITLPEEPEQEKTYTIRVLTYNIFHGETTRGQIDMDLFAKIIADETPDLVALQEVDKNTVRSGGIDQTAELSKRTGLTGYFGKSRVFDGGDFGVSILSKLPVEEFKVIPAYKVGTYGGAYAYAKVKLADNTYIYFNSSHLGTALEEREVHVKEIVNYYKNALKNEPLIICGDLNAQYNDTEMQPLWNDFQLSDPSLGNTFSTRTGMRSKIDFVLYPKIGNWKVVSTKRICRADASDHCALLSVLEYKK